MIRVFESKNTFKLNKCGSIVKELEWWEEWEQAVNEVVIIDDAQYRIIDVDRNRCSGFFFGTDEEWEKRNVFAKVEELC